LFTRNGIFAAIRARPSDYLSFYQYISAIKVSNLKVSFIQRITSEKLYELTWQYLFIKVPCQNEEHAYPLSAIWSIMDQTDSRTDTHSRK